MHYQQRADKAFRVRSKPGFKLKFSVWAQGQIIPRFIVRNKIWWALLTRYQRKMTSIWNNGNFKVFASCATCGLYSYHQNNTQLKAHIQNSGPSSVKHIKYMLKLIPDWKSKLKHMFILSHLLKCFSESGPDSGEWEDLTKPFSFYFLFSQNTTLFNRGFRLWITNNYHNNLCKKKLSAHITGLF